MKKYGKEQIREIAADIFSHYPKAMNVAVTEDGQAFITDESDAAARNHAREKRYKQPLRIGYFRREELEQKPKANSDSDRKKENGKKAEDSAQKTSEDAPAGKPETESGAEESESKEPTKTEEL